MGIVFIYNRFNNDYKRWRLVRRRIHMDSRKEQAYHPGIIAATIISVATTLPELFVSTVASNEGFSEMAVGNALGSLYMPILHLL